MTMHQTKTGLDGSVEKRDGLLRLALKPDAVASGALGILILLAAGTVIGDGRPFVLLLGTPLALLVPVGLFLVVFAALVWIVGSRRRINRTAAWSVVAINALWVLGSVSLVVAGWIPLTALGVAFVLVQATAVCLFAGLQFLAEETMNITVIGRGNVGGGLAGRWEKAGHAVTRLGREGGDASDAGAVLVTVPSGRIADALGKVSGLEGKIAIDAANAFDGHDEEHGSLAHEMKSIVGGPVAKAFNLQSAALYDRIDEQRVHPSNLCAGGGGLRRVTECLIRDAGYDRVSVGGLDRARALEDSVGLFVAIRQAGGGPHFHRFAKTGEL